jgi:hypothetical protein
LFFWFNFFLIFFIFFKLFWILKNKKYIILIYFKIKNTLKKIYCRIIKQALGARHGMRVIQLRSQRIKTCDPPKHFHKRSHFLSTFPRTNLILSKPIKKPSHQIQLISLLTNSFPKVLSLRFFCVFQGLEFHFMVYALHFSIFSVLHVIDVSFFIYIYELCNHRVSVSHAAWMNSC